MERIDLVHMRIVSWKFDHLRDELLELLIQNGDSDAIRLQRVAISLNGFPTYTHHPLIYAIQRLQKICKIDQL